MSRGIFPTTSFISLQGLCRGFLAPVFPERCPEVAPRRDGAGAIEGRTPRAALQHRRLYALILSVTLGHLKILLTSVVYQTGENYLWPCW